MSINICVNINVLCQNFFPFPSRFFLTGIPYYFSIFRSTNWEGKATMINLSCFSLYLFGLLSFFFLKFCGGRRGGGGVVREIKLDEDGRVIERVGH